MMTKQEEPTDTQAPSSVPAIQKQQAISFRPGNIGQAFRLAEQLSKSKLLPTALQGKPADTLVVLISGHELGLSPMQSIRGLHVIQGKASMSSDLMQALVVSKSDICHWFRLVESTEEHATYETLRKGHPEPVSMTYTVEDARKADLINKDNWKRHRAAMLRARACSALCRAVYPDLMMGVYTLDESEEFADPEILNITEEVISHVPSEPAETPEPVDMPQRKSKAKKGPAPKPQTVEAEVIIEPEEEPEPEPPPPEDTDAPYWRGRVADVEMKDGGTKGRKWKLFTIIGHDNNRFQSFDEKFANFAREAFKKKKNIAITYEKTPRGGQKITEIRLG
jgi:hypothetical protein